MHPTVPADDGGVRHAQRPDRPAVDDDVVGTTAELTLQSREGALHREHGGVIHVQSIDLARARRAEGDRQRAPADERQEAFALGGGEPFRVVDAGDRPRVRGHDDGAGDDRAGERATPDLVDARDEWAVRRAKRPLEGAPTRTARPA